MGSKPAIATPPAAPPAPTAPDAAPATQAPPAPAPARLRRRARLAARIVGAACALALACVGVVYAAEQIAQAPNYDWYTGNPAADTFTVSTGGQLRGLANLVNGTADLDGDGVPEAAVSFEGKTIKQASNRPISLANAEWTPIGTAEHPFEGTFIGGGNATTGDIRRMTITQGYAYLGLFGYCGSHSSIQNVYLSAATATGYAPSSITLSDADEGNLTAETVFHDIGAVVGYSEGSVTGCTSVVPITVSSQRQTVAADPLAVVNLGGIAGTVEGSVANCATTASLTVTVPSLSSDTQDAVAGNIGGVVGTLGKLSADGRTSSAGSITNCTYGYSDESDQYAIGRSQVKIHVITEGVGGVDRFGVEKEATSLNVGGIAGYSFGSVDSCTNFGLVNTNAVDVELYKSSDGRAHIVAADDLKPASYPNAEDLFKKANGANGTGGIVGSLRGDGLGLSNQERAYTTGSADNRISLTNCFNTGSVVGLAGVGGIAGRAGTYADISNCRNGRVDGASGTGVNDDSGHVVSTRWNKPYTGGIAGTTYSNLFNCSNLTEVENIQTGYYTAGVLGGLFSPDEYTSECYSCFNTGQVHVTSNATHTYREAGIVGNNAGYVHDSVMRSGSVLAHDDGDAEYPNAAIGDDSWGKWSNLKFFSSSELKKSEAAAVLNAGHAQDVLTLPEAQWTYWYISGQGYPTLNAWDAPASRTQLTSENVTASCSQPAEFAGNVEAIPTLVVNLKLSDGTTANLVQNVDFYVIPQVGATAMTDGATPYKASIIGIGNYTGTVSDVCSYGIGPCDLKNCDVSVSQATYNFDTPVYPAAVYVTNPAGAQLDAADYRYEIYDGSTYALTSGNQKRGVVFDSEGYVSWDGGATRQTVSSAHELLSGDLADTDYVLYNADGEAIFKVEGGTQYIVDPLTGEASEGLGPIYYKPAREGVTGGGLAGYIVKVSAKAESKNLKSDSWTTGQYVVDSIDLYKGATIDHVDVTIPAADGTSTQSFTWYWDSEKSTLYALDASGNPEKNADGTLKQASLPFTGSEVQPEVEVTYIKGNGTKVTVPNDVTMGYYLVYGDPNTTKQDLPYVNRDATPLADLAAGATETEDGKTLREQLKNHEKAAVTVRSVLNLRYSNYVHMYFAIESAKLDTCAIDIAGTPVADAQGDNLTQCAYTGGYAVRPSVGVTLAGNQLEKGTDFTVTYENNTAETTDEALQAYYESGDTSGLASYTVTGLGNVTGSYTGYFAIKGGTNLAQEGYTIAPVADQQYNFGQPVQAPGGVTLLDAQGNKASLVEGVDYTVTYTNNVYVGVAGIAVTGINKYTGRLTAQFNIRQFDVAANYSTRTTGWVFERPEWETGGVEYGYGTGAYMRGYAVTDWTLGVLDKTNTNLIEFEWTAVNKATGQVFRNTTTSSAAAYMTPGEYTVTFTPYCMVAIEGSNSSLTYQNMYTGTLTRDVTVVKQDIAKRSWLDVADVAYNGQPQEVMATSAAHTKYWIAGDMQKLNDPTQFSVQWENNVAAGTATYTVRALPQSQLYTGSYVGTFNITKLDVAKASVSVPDQLYSGKELTPKVTVTVDGFELTEGTDYTVAYANNTNRGQATVTVTGAGSCEGTATATFAIGNRLNLAQAQVAPIADQLYTGSAVEPKPQVTYNGKTLAEGVDYTLSYSSNTQATTEKSPAKVTISGKAGTSYAGSSITATFNIVKARDIAGAQASNIPDQVYTGNPLTPAFTVTYDGQQLAEGTDYTVEYRRNVKAGAPACAVVKGINTFEGELQVPFNIVVKNGEVARAGEAAEVPQQFALAVAQQAYPQGAQGVIVANEHDYAAQTAAAVYGAQRGWPVLLTTGNGAALNTETLSYVRASGATQALVLGNESTVATQVQTALQQGLSLQVQRLDAANSQTLAVQLASLVAAQAQATAKAGETPAALTTAVVANPADTEGAAAAAALAAAQQVPLYYTAEDGTLTAQAQAALAKAQTVIIAGGYAQVDAQVESALPAAATVTRLAGDTRYAQNAATTAYALENGLQATGAVVVNAPSLTHQLTALTLAAQAKAPLVLAATQSMQGVEALAAAEVPAYGVTLLGGEAAFPAALASQVTQTMNW